MSESSINASPFDEVLAFFRESSNLSEYGNNFESMKEAYVSTRALSGDGIANISDYLQRIIFEQAFFNLLIAAKLKYIFSGASDCFNNKNVIGLAYFARAALEHVATYAYVVNKSESAVEKLTGQNNPQKAHDTIKALSASFHVSYYGSGDRNAQSRVPQKPVHIHDTIGSLDNYFGKVGDTSDQDSASLDRHSFLFQESLSRQEAIDRFGISFDPFPQKTLVRSDYDFLCDFVHPNYGSNFLVSTGTIAEGSIDAPNEQVSNLNILFVKKCLRYWLYYKELLKLDFIAHLNFSTWLQRSHKRGAKASRIFSRRASKIEGDGQSVQSAYSFPRARDSNEEHQMFKDLLQRLRVSRHEQSIAELSEEFIVDRIEADNGKIFFAKFLKRNLP